MNNRIAALQKMLERNPNDVRAHFGIAAELEKEAAWPQMIDHLRQYLAQSDDQGNAWGRLAKGLALTGRREEAAAAYRRGIEAAQRHGHPSMAAEFEEALEELEN